MRNDLGEFNLVRMIGVYLFLFLAVSSQFSSVFRLSMKMSISLVGIRQLNSNFLLDKQLFQAFKTPWIDILNC